MTAGHDGTPENDDPFGYLYRSEGGAGEQPEQAAPQQLQPGQPRVPRTSHHQVQRVGERRSPQQQPGGYGYPQQQPGAGGGYGYPQQQPYGYEQGQQGQGHPQAQGQQQPFTGRPPQHTQAQPQYSPQQPPGGGRRSGAGPGQGGGGSAPSRRGLLIGAVAVVVAVAIGIAFAMTRGSGDDKNTADSKPTTPAVTNTAPSTQPTPSATATPFDSKPVGVATLTLGGSAKQSTQWTGAKADGGTYVDTLAPNGSVTWTVTVPEDGPYTFFISFGNAGADANLTQTVNGKPRTTPVALKNYSKTTDWSKAWGTTTYTWVTLKKGANTLALSCQPGNQCGVNLDQFWLKQGSVKN